MSQLSIVSHSKKVEGFIQRISDNVTLEMVLIPSGTFMMGAPQDEEDSEDNEKPQHLVSVPSFFMGRYPITQEQWRTLVELEPPIAQDLKPNPSDSKGNKRPVEQVSWYDAVEFCARLSKFTGKNYRLPSEAEWEYACRGGTTTPFHFGQTISTELANYYGEDSYGIGQKGKYRGETTDVDSFKVANEFGLSGMHGNVWEWCLDPWHDNYEGAPNDGTVWDEENKNDNLYQNLLDNINVLTKYDRRRVLRGGSFGTNPRDCRSACRSNDLPDVHYNDLGFRIVCVPPRT
ncbi:MAG: formylglycine-generating enzyme family protein [Microcystaceae cyanobacterium]